MTIDASVRRRWIQLGIVLGLIVIALAMILPAIQQAREAARRSLSKNNLRQLGLALENYQDIYRRLPYGGIFDDQGTPFHGWTTALDLLLSQRAWYDAPDPNYPWDDPVNIDHIIQELSAPFQNPSIDEKRSPDGLPLAHFAANQLLFHRNSSVSLDELTEKGGTALLGDCNGNFPPIGYPFNWRDLSIPLGSSPEGFGCPVREITMVLMADGSVRYLDNLADGAVLRSLAGPDGLRPSPDKVVKPLEPYRLKTSEYWRYLHIVRAHKSLMTFGLSPNRKSLNVDFRRYDRPEDATPDKWSGYFRDFVKSAPIEQVELKGELRADELRPFLEMPTIKQLGIRDAKISDDRDAVLATAKKDLVID